VQAHQRGGPAVLQVAGPQFRQHTGAAHAFAHLPAPAAQFAGHQSGGLLLMAAELGMAMQVAAQLDQLGQQTL
jgi:hypothetical protein